MRFSDVLEMSVRSLWRRKLRTCLTILGVIIGSTSIILMLSLGVAMDESFKQQIKEMRSLTIIEVSPNIGGGTKVSKLDDKALRSLEQIEGVKKVIPTRRLEAYLRVGKYRTDSTVEIRGLSAEEAEILGYQVAIGKIVKPGIPKTIVLGNEITKQFVKPGQHLKWDGEMKSREFEIGKEQIKIDIGQYDTEKDEPMADKDGRQVEIPHQERVTVIGLFKEDDWENNYSALVPLELFEKIQEEQIKYNKQLNGGTEEKSKDKNKYQSVRVKVIDEEHVEAVQKAIKEAGFRAESAMEYLNKMKKLSSSIQMMLGGIGSISLIVAAIGITNTMMMSIYERTKEIGVMKVIGATILDIKKLFLVEALLIGSLGGIFGIIISYIGSYLINHFGIQMAGDMLSITEGGRVSIIPLWLTLGALGFSTLIGVLAGYFPAKRATNLSALTALKTD